MKRLLCLLLGHRHLVNVNPRLSIVFWCPRCAQLVPGEYSARRARR